MGLFWKRKKSDEFVTLGLNEPLAKPQQPAASAEPLADPADIDRLTKPTERSPTTPELIPSVSGAGPAPIPVVPEKPVPPVVVSRESMEQTREKPVRSRSPFATSVLGLNLSMEELQAQEAALEQEFSNR